jgi:predicted nucleic acid-binding protein
MTVYCDTSFFLRQLLPGDLRDLARNIGEELENRFRSVPITNLTRFEVVQALRFEVWRYRNDRTKGFSPVQIDLALNLFIAEIGSSLRPVEVEWDDVLLQAESLSRTTGERGWRTVDLLHVASAKCLGVSEFFTFDLNQNALAAEEGFTTPLSGYSV